MAQIIAGSHLRAEFLQQVGVDPEQDADLTLQEVCWRQEMHLARVIDLLARIDCWERPQALRDESQVSLTQLADYVVAKHHEYLRRELPRLQMLLDLASRHEVTHESERIRTVFESLRSGIEHHMVMEEQVLFPLIQEIDWASRVPGQYAGGIGYAITQATHDRHCFEQTMTKLRALTSDFTAPAQAPIAYRSFLKGLAALESDMKQHGHLETEILIPRAIEAEARLRNRPDEPYKSKPPTAFTRKETENQTPSYAGQ